MISKLPNKSVINKPFQAHLSFPDFQEELLTEIRLQGGEVFEQNERLILCSPLKAPLIWSQCTWLNPEWLEISSISDAVEKLKAQQALWMGYSFHLHRRSDLIQARLLRMAPKPLKFLKSPPSKNFGAWSLWKENLILASATTTSSLPLGLAVFEEDKSLPSRAYLKLWELFTLHEKPPEKGVRVLDLGSSPGGWTWVLSDLLCDVVSVDKAALDPRLLQRKNITVLKKDAFHLKPQDIGEMDTVFSDIICEPERLYSLVLQWLDSKLCKRLICTIKFKGPTNFDMIQKFLAIPGSRIVHLCANKHELTWICHSS